MNYPIVKIEIESFRHKIAHAMSDYTGEINSIIAHELEEQLSESAFLKLISEEVDCRLKESIKDNIKSYFAYGDGNKIIREELIKKLNESD